MKQEHARKQVDREPKEVVISASSTETRIKRAACFMFGEAINYTTQICINMYENLSLIALGFKDLPVYINDITFTTLST